MEAKQSLAVILTAVHFFLPLTAAYADSHSEQLQELKTMLPQINDLVKNQPTGKNLFARGSLHFMLHDFEKAESDLAAAEALHFNEQPFELNQNRGASLLILKRYPEALESLNKALKVKPNSAIALANRGSAYCELKQYREALNDSLEAIRYDSRISGAYNTIGDCYLKSGQYKYAIQYLDQTIKRSPKNFEAFHLRGEAYQKLGQAVAAARDFATAKALGYAPGKAYVEDIY